MQATESAAATTVAEQVDQARDWVSDLWGYCAKLRAEKIGDPAPVTTVRLLDRTV